MNRRLPFDWDENWYVERYQDIADAIAHGRLADPLQHYLEYGYREGRFATAAAERRAQCSPDPASDAEPRCTQLGNNLVPRDWPVQGEAKKAFTYRMLSGFFHRYMSGQVVLDIGYRAGRADALPIFPHAIGVDLDYPGYDGVRLPFGDNTVDTIFSSHMLEHVENPRATLCDWFRTVKPEGFIVCIVPHQFLYERKTALPSRWSSEHVRFYTPASLLQLCEESWEPNSYRIKHLADNDLGYSYELSPDRHPSGCYEIELVVQKINRPSWTLC